jgi:para-nitrobenzyl esterase
MVQRSSGGARLWMCVAVSVVVLGACTSDDDASDDVATTTTTEDVSTYAGATVSVAGGDLAGVVERETRSFYGVPYAAPPVGDGRWAPPEPADGWNGVRQATQPGAACQQNVNTSFGEQRVPVSEDCLFLNVHAPASATGTRPVLVWFHGGGYTGGMGDDYDGRSIAADDDMVVVTVNYRLGVFGFLATSGLTADSGTDSSGNYGIQDQRASMEWVRDNIAAFGGDPGRVTIAGQSAGSGSVCVHTVSPESAGLFHGAIMMAGMCAGCRPMPTLADAESEGDGFAATVGCPGDGAASVTCLRAKPADELTVAGGGGSTGGTTAIPLRPIVDGKVLPDQPNAILADGEANDGPVIIGYNIDEGNGSVYLQYERQGTPVTAEGYPAAVADSFPGSDDVAAILERYPLSDFRTPSNALGRIRSDQSICRIQSATEEFATEMPTYAYEFAERDTPFLGGKPETLDLGAAHAFELQYLFEVQPIPLIRAIPLTLDARQQAVADSLVAYFAAFAADGAPGDAGGPEWPEYDVDDPRRVSFGSNETTVEVVLDDRQCDFWAGREGS